jgi:hypothetical protein
MQSKSSVVVKVCPRIEPSQSTAGPPAIEWSPAPAHPCQEPAGAGEAVTVTETALRAGTTGSPHYGAPISTAPRTSGDKRDGGRGLDG